MAIVFAQNVIEIAVIATYAQRPVANVLHIYNDEQTGSDESKAQDFANNWQDHMLTGISDGYVLDRFEWRSLDPDDANVGIITPDPAKPTTGGNTSPALPPNVAFLIHKRTQNRPRGRRDGRIFLPGVPEASAGNDGFVPAATVTAMNGYLASFVSGVNDDAWNGSTGSGLCVLETTPESRVPGTQEVTLGWRAVTELACDSYVATQRDRLR